MKNNSELITKMRNLGYVTVPEAEERTQVHRVTIYTALKEGKLVSKKVRGRHFLEIEAFLNWAGDGARLLWEAEAEAS